MNAKYETMGRWKAKGYRYPVIYTRTSLNTLLRDPNNSNNTGREDMQRWEDAIGPIMEDICNFPWRGSDMEQQTAEAERLSKATGVDVRPWEVNTNSTLWASLFTQ
jgi:hypothetical protein